MPKSGISRLAGVVAGVLLALSAGLAAAEPPTAAPEVARRYIGPHTLVDVGGGRKMNLFCMGEGDRTVLFDSGGSDWSVIWALVQPEAARGARACAYDRAGLGYSDPFFMPRSPMAIVEDMHALIHASDMKRPLVLVGHSLGGFNVKLYAAMYPQDVAGLVLVDPSEERAWDRSRAAMRKRFGEKTAIKAELMDYAFRSFLMQKYRRCLDLAVAGPLDPRDIVYRRCSDPERTQLGPDLVAERHRIQVTPSYQTAQASEVLNSIYGDERGDPLYARLFRPGMFGNMPLVVLSHSEHDPKDELDLLGFVQGVALHRETARLSRRGVQRVVPNTRHNIELDAPDAIVAAVREVLGGAT